MEEEATMTSERREDRGGNVNSLCTMRMEEAMTTTPMRSEDGGDGDGSVKKVAVAADRRRRCVVRGKWGKSCGLLISMEL